MDNCRSHGPTGSPRQSSEAADPSSPSSGSAGSTAASKRKAVGTARSTIQPTSWPLALGALGVVFGDIDTSPLYALHTAFSMEHNKVTVAPENVYGIISMVLWTITLIVTVKYVLPYAP
ncbi:potassium transport protein Kup (plasmid) [Corynebacterium occultum]|uniref:Potassium transport protein Kup n=1 Tax=Corynebacterium occultum TaxID=2675219 RepID=A0A6B8W0Q5_9CORY|nr:KUP/HAK/KT family potassium transporter [Corynebacterium occultum]QGU08759.1 potassium transport protein Kup [Corynebacterium occultum]